MSRMQEFRWGLGDMVALLKPDGRKIQMPGKVIAQTVDLELNRTYASIKWHDGRRTIESENALRRA